MDNPLLDFADLPRFAEVRPDHITPAVDQVLAAARATVEAITADDVPKLCRECKQVTYKHNLIYSKEYSVA